MRKLNPDERRLWDFVTRSVTPLRPRHASDTQADETPPAKTRAGHKAESSAPATPEQKAAPHRTAHIGPLHVGKPIDLDGATAKKFKRGRMPVDARLDLHGLTLAQAHGALISFVRTQADHGARCVLVITGKGAQNQNDFQQPPKGRIKAELIHWLNAAPLRAFILAVTEAGPRQGGSGAVYVMLKRRDRVRD